MNPREQIEAVGALMPKIDAKVLELWDLLCEAREYGAAVPVHCLWRANSTAVKWWKPRRELVLKKLEKKAAYDAAVLKLTKEERKVLGL
jgi:hypothetical protein